MRPLNLDSLFNDSYFGNYAVDGSWFDNDEFYNCLVVKNPNMSAILPSCILNGTRFTFPTMNYSYYYYGEEDNAGWDFLDIYYSKTRFAVETAMALLSMTLNVLDGLCDLKRFVLFLIKVSNVFHIQVL